MCLSTGSYSKLTSKRAQHELSTMPDFQRLGRAWLMVFFRPKAAGHTEALTWCLRQSFGKRRRDGQSEGEHTSTTQILSQGRGEFTGLGTFHLQKEGRGRLFVGVLFFPFCVNLGTKVCSEMRLGLHPPTGMSVTQPPPPGVR